MDPADYVLATFRPDERDAVDAAIAQAVELILGFVGAGVSPPPPRPRSG
jgi:peptidyl-tRNA hydrolase